MVRTKRVPTNCMWTACLQQSGFLIAFRAVLIITVVIICFIKSYDAHPSIPMCIHTFSISNIFFQPRLSVDNFFQNLSINCCLTFYLIIIYKFYL